MADDPSDYDPTNLGGDYNSVSDTYDYGAPAGGSSSSDDLGPVSAGQSAVTGANTAAEGQHNINAINAAPNPTPSGLSGVLSSLGSNTGVGLLTALTGILSAAGHMKTAQANSKLPAMPAMGSLPSLPNSGVTSGQYGPNGGYSYQNYAGLGANAPGTGYSPRVQAAPKPMASYYTYGQGPEQQFFQQVQPGGGSIAPVTAGQKKGGKVRLKKKYAVGGPVFGAAPPMSGAPAPMAGVGGPPPGPRPMSGIGLQPGTMGGMAPAPQMPTPAPRQMGMAGGPRPMMSQPQPMMGRPMMRAAGGTTGTEGALSVPEQGSRYVRGPGDGTSDDIPARLANGEYVLSADVVSGLGNGDNNSGAKVLDGFVKNLRTHKAENAAKGKLPADAKPIHHYMGGKS